MSTRVKETTICLGGIMQGREVSRVRDLAAKEQLGPNMVEVPQDTPCTEWVPTIPLRGEEI